MTIDTAPSDFAPTLVEAGDPAARPALVLHGGGGPRTMAPLVGHLAETMHVIAPTHPGWDGTPRPEDLTSVASLAAGYLALLEERGLRDVVLVGSSFGGWVALEMAVQAARSRVGGGAPERTGTVGAVVVIDAVGPVVPGIEPVDIASLDARGLAEHAWHDPERGYIDPATVPAEQAAIQRDGIATMRLLGGPALAAPALLGDIRGIDVPALVLWGASDRMVTPEYGAAIAAAIDADTPGTATFVVIPEAGHLPQLESPVPTFAAVDAFLA